MLTNGGQASICCTPTIDQTLILLHSTMMSEEVRQGYPRAGRWQQMCTRIAASRSSTFGAYTSSVQHGTPQQAFEFQRLTTWPSLQLPPSSNTTPPTHVSAQLESTFVRIHLTTNSVQHLWHPIAPLAFRQGSTTHICYSHLGMYNRPHMLSDNRWDTTDIWGIRMQDIYLLSY